MFVRMQIAIEDRIILGIDPGTTVLGYGLIHIKNKKITLINYGVIQLKKYDNQPDKLKKIYERINSIIMEYHPDEMAIEAPFFGKNVQSMLKLGRAQGVCIAASLKSNVPYEEYSPRRIKQAVTGNGGASKEQVSGIVQRILNMKEEPSFLDATDGLAAAICHYYSKGKGENNKTKASSWEAFVKQNPDRNKSPKKGK